MAVITLAIDPGAKCAWAARLADGAVAFGSGPPAVSQPSTCVVELQRFYGAVQTNPGKRLSSGAASAAALIQLAFVAGWLARGADAQHTVGLFAGEWRAELAVHGANRSRSKRQVDLDVRAAVSAALAWEPQPRMRQDIWDAVGLLLGWESLVVKAASRDGATAALLEHCSTPRGLGRGESPVPVIYAFERTQQ